MPASTCQPGALKPYSYIFKYSGIILLLAWFWRELAGAQDPLDSIFIHLCGGMAEIWVCLKIGSTVWPSSVIFPIEMAVLGYSGIPTIFRHAHISAFMWQVCAGLSLWWPEASAELQRDGGLDMSVKGELVQKDHPFSRPTCHICPSTKVEINKTFGIPLPTLSALVGPLLLLAGSGMYLTGIPVARQNGALSAGGCGCGWVGSLMLIYWSIQYSTTELTSKVWGASPKWPLTSFDPKVFMEIGAECLLLFLLMSTCFVHFKPLQQSGGGTRCCMLTAVL